MINLTLNLDIWARVLLEEAVVLMDLTLEIGQRICKFLDKSLLLEYLQELALAKILSESLDLPINLR